MHAELVARGAACTLNTVAKLMKSLGIRAASHRKVRVRTTDSDHEFPTAANRLDRNFAADAPDKVWLADVTYIPTRRGWL
ncbi:MAG: IS3 family transposase, partial [Planctomycetia bacterium]